ncbi:Thiamin-phosphate pyrophosphorylase [hydrothermal vent metagenome]|uniref:thiamine phosphate synthase n=1 Tax=hydrothermal vent metagenome TaxID=652676 RepID=A0A3B0YA56_9ZZZZ
MNKKLSGLYAITNEKLMPEAVFLDMAEAALAGGVRVLQYRDKSTNQTKRQYQATELKKLCAQYSATFIINDDIDLAMQVDADGVHIGKNDLSFLNARKKLSTNKIIGVSCYNQISLAREAINSGANYIAFGRFFDSSIKPEAPIANINLISKIKKTSNIPLCCIGGITSENHSPLINAGADMLAVISDVFSQQSTIDITNKCKQFLFFRDNM